MDTITYNKILNNEIDIKYLSINDMINFVLMASEEESITKDKIKNIVNTISNQKEELKSIKDQLNEESN